MGGPECQCQDPDLVNTWSSHLPGETHQAEVIQEDLKEGEAEGAGVEGATMFSSRSAKDCQERNAELCQENSVVQPLLTDLYQLTMAYAYWKSGKIDDIATFDLYFRKNPFKGEFTIFAGLGDCVKLLENFHYSETDITYLRSVLPDTVEEEFYEFLQSLSPKDVTIHAVAEGSVVFPKVPLLRITGPLIVVQLLETTFLTLVNFASLITTNASRYRIAAGKDLKLLEFGLRRAQGPDGGLTASKYAYIGGFDGTSNVLAGKLYGIPVRGTHAHAFVTSFTGLEDLQNNTLAPNDGTEQPEMDFVSLSVDWRAKLGDILNILVSEAHDGELAAFISYAMAFPNNFVALIDTYDVSKSGLLNFCAVAMALNDYGYKAIGIRIDSGDLAYLSRVVRETMERIGKQFELQWFKNMVITASNDINEETILSLNEQGHKITCFGIGTHLVTCQRQPALGCVYKLVEVNGKPKIKLSQDVHKVTMPGPKNAFRLYSSDGHALIDLMLRPDEEPPEVGKRVLCRHPFEESKRAYVMPHKVEALYKVVWENGKVSDMPTLDEIRENVKESLRTLRQDHKRSLNPTPYKVGVSDDLYHFIHDLWLENAPIGELS